MHENSFDTGDNINTTCNDDTVTEYFTGNEQSDVMNDSAWES